MANVLYLVHRLPYPPNKGDKVRSYHLLKHLAGRHKVFLGTFIDDPDDEVHVGKVRNFCAALHVARLRPIFARARSLFGYLGGKALTLGYYRDHGLHSWVRRIIVQHRIDAVVIFSSAMGQYVDLRDERLLLVDFVDVDSAKWTQYATTHRFPLSWLYGGEGKRLLEFERKLAARANRSFFVTENEAALFRGLSPETAAKVEVLCNGVDADFFSPDAARPSPYAVGRPDHPKVSVVFTGAMDYWPNIDAVTWFASDILPTLRRNWPHICFYVVGRNPPPSVRALQGDAIVVTGTVEDVRPYLQHASVVVAPLRIARGIQNKILEAMAMGRPVVASRQCVEAVDAVPGLELLAASDADEFVAQVDALLRAPQRCDSIGAAGRQRVLQSYSWTAHLAGIDHHLRTSFPS